MEAKELRIGNLVYRQTLNIIPANFINKEIVIVGFIDEEEFPNDISNQYCGIPLTEQFLLDFGFAEHKNYFILQKSDYQILHKGDNTFIVFHEQLSAYYGIEIKFVHKLQNFFYETGTELTLNPSTDVK